MPYLYLVSHSADEERDLKLGLRSCCARVELVPGRCCARVDGSSAQALASRRPALLGASFLGARGR